MFKKITVTPTSSVCNNLQGSWKDLQYILQILQKNLIMFKECVHRKKFGRIIDEINLSLSNSITVDNPRSKNIIKNVYDLKWITQSNIHSIIGKLTLWNQEIQAKIIEYKKHELRKYSQIINKRQYEPLVILQQNNIQLGEFTKIRRSTLAEYMLLYNRQVN